MKQLYCKNCNWTGEPDAACPVWCPECNQPLYIRDYVSNDIVTPKSVILPYIESFTKNPPTPIPNYKIIKLPKCCITCRHWAYEEYWCIKYGQETGFYGVCDSWEDYDV